MKYVLTVEETKRFTHDITIETDDTECNHHGDISADCQRWICNNSYDCENCDYIKSYVKLMREKNTEKK